MSESLTSAGSLSSLSPTTSVASSTMMTSPTLMTSPIQANKVEVDQQNEIQNLGEFCDSKFWILVTTRYHKSALFRAPAIWVELCAFAQCKMSSMT